MFLSNEMKNNIAQTEYYTRLAELTQSDKLTRLALIVNKTLGFALLPVRLLSYVTTFILGIGVSISFGLLAWILSFIWWIFLVPLLGSSWLWLKSPFLRPLLLIPGILWARLADLWAVWMPSMGELDARHTKLCLCDSWPVSWHIIRPPKEYSDQDAEMVNNAGVLPSVLRKGKR